MNAPATRKEAAWLLRELPGLVGRGVLDQASADRLRAEYAAQASPSGLGWGMILLAAGGAALIGLGIILIFAHNWENWTPGVRVALSLLPLVAGQTACAYALRSGGRAWCEAAAAFTAIAIGASIALIAQTYQMGGDLPRFLLIWLLLAAPLVYLLDATAAAVLCWLLALGWALASHHSGWWGQAGTLQDVLRLPAFLVLFSLPLPHLVRHLLLDRTGARVSWMLRVALPAVAIGLFAACEPAQYDNLLPVYAGMSAAAVLAGRRYFSGPHGLWGNPLQLAGSIGVFVIALTMTFGDALRAELPHSTLAVLLALLAGIAGWLAWRDWADGDRLLAALLGAFAPLVFLEQLFAGRLPGLTLLVAHLYVLALAAALVRSGLQTSRLSLANEGVSLVAVLVLLRFFDSDLSYVTRGVGFIVTGVGFFAAVVWLRRRVRQAGP